MKVAYLYTGEDNRSHWTDIDIPLNDLQRGTRSSPIATTDMLFRESQGDAHYLELHVAPRRQFILCLSGEVEVACGDGTARRFGPGDIYLVDDLTGEGHSHREVRGPLRHAWIGLPDDLDLDAWRVD